MSERFNQLTAHHSNLRVRAALQRQQLAAHMHDIERRLGGVDRGISSVRHALRSPAMIVGGIALLALLGPKRIFRWVGRSALLATTARRLMRLRRR
jgi:hypothetical protein